ncbi:MAG TPA: hydrogenase maturation nickel metallochaperone HypA [Jatrophihabitans sp.]|nr:hydrogenase maturation nickel metallochaperone HypA [Jatrophihabitans sp.]
MHELAIAESMVDAVLEHTGTAEVRAVRLEVGTLAGVLPDALRFCFELAADGTPLAGAQLDISEPGGLAHCRHCGADFGVDGLILLCPCGSADVRVLSGQQLRILSVEVG